MHPHLDHALDFIYSHLKAFQAKEIQNAYEVLSDCYRSKGNTRTLTKESSIWAYLAARMPATYAVLFECLEKIPKDFKPNSVLDLGAGPGTGTLAALDLWPDIQAITSVEQHPLMNKFAGQLITKPIDRIQKDIVTFETMQTYDLVILSYVLGELTQEQQLSVLEKALRAARGFLVITTPGTPRDYQNLMTARRFLIERGGHVLAPCPHQNACPLEQTKDWCHFSVRVNRTKSHKMAKQASLTFEDEKFSYLIVGKERAPENFGRLIRKPIRKPGHVLLDVCTSTGVRREIITKKQKDVYRVASKKEWGDTW